MNKSEIINYTKTLPLLGQIEVIEKILLSMRSNIGVSGKIDSNKKIPLKKQDQSYVTPGKFDHIKEGIFCLSKNPSIQIDIKKSDRDVAEQLKKHGLTSKDVNSFRYSLKKRAKLL